MVVVELFLNLNFHCLLLFFCCRQNIKTSKKQCFDIAFLVCLGGSRGSFLVSWGGPGGVLGVIFSYFDGKPTKKN